MSRRLSLLHDICSIAHLRLGLEHRGFIRSEVSLAQVRPPYPAAVEALRETCRRTFAELLHSLYLTGSVVKGTALASPISMRWQSCRWSQRLSTTQQRAWTEVELRDLGHRDDGELFFFQFTAATAAPHADPIVRQ